MVRIDKLWAISEGNSVEIRDPIHGTVPLNDVEVSVIDSVVFQRLRSIKQLGFSEFSFPGATHNRYIHSIGVCHLAGHAFDSIFKKFKFSNEDVRDRFRQVLRLAALLHDSGHGPLSHTTEEVMPKLSDLKVDVYKKSNGHHPEDRQANHEDYTIKFITDSVLTEKLSNNPYGITAYHVACLIDKSLVDEDDFFVDQGLNFRTILSQLVSSEMDVDRMDYLLRDAYFCGTNYGKVELSWLMDNLTYHEEKGNLNLALNRRALYTFDDFLLSRHHMHLMVYFHHKCIIYEEMLYRYLTSEDCSFYLPSNIDEYLRCTDYALYEHLAKVQNPWARRISERNPYKMLFELHSLAETGRVQNMQKALEGEGIDSILSSSTVRLSKYHTASDSERAVQIFVVDQYDKLAKPYPIEESTEIFQKYEEIRRIERLYIAPEHVPTARKYLVDKKL